MNKANKILAVVFGSAIAIAFVAGAVVSANAAGYVFTRNLTVGSKGADVVELQKVLNSNPATVVALTGVGSAGMESSYFGGLTKAAVVKFQLSKGIVPALGYVGSLTLAELNKVSVVVTPTTPATPVVNNGVEGTISVTQSNAGLPSSIYEGNSKVGVLSFKVEAKNSNVTIQRVKVDLGASTSIYNKKFNKIYVLDGSSVIASSDLNSDTVVKDGSEYFITLAGMNLVVSKDSTKVLTVAVDVKSTVDTLYRSPYTSTFRLATDGVRGVDGAGLNQYAGNTDVTRNIAISSDQVDSATLKLSLDTNSPKATQVIASNGSDKNEADKVAFTSFNLKADKDNILVTDIVATTTNNSKLTTAYLFDGSNEIANSAIVAGVATFNNIDLTVKNGYTKTLTIKVDVRNAVGTFTASSSVLAVGITAENSNGDSITATGSAVGEDMTITKAGAAITLLSKGTATSKVTDQSGNATTTLTGTFTYLVTANGSDIVLGTVGSTTSPFATSSSFKVYKDGAYSNTATIAGVAYSTPDSGVTLNGTNSFTITDGNSATVVVDVRFVGSTALGTHTYAIQTSSLNVNNAAVTFMDGQSAWRTLGVTLP